MKLRKFNIGDEDEEYIVHNYSFASMYVFLNNEFIEFGVKFWSDNALDVIDIAGIVNFKKLDTKNTIFFLSKNIGMGEGFCYLNINPDTKKIIMAEFNESFEDSHRSLEKDIFTLKGISPETKFELMIL